MTDTKILAAAPADVVAGANQLYDYDQALDDMLGLTGEPVPWSRADDATRIAYVQEAMYLEAKLNDPDIDTRAGVIDAIADDMTGVTDVPILSGYDAEYYSAEHARARRFAAHRIDIYLEGSELQ